MILHLPIPVHVTECNVDLSPRERLRSVFLSRDYSGRNLKSQVSVFLPAGTRNEDLALSNAERRHWLLPLTSINLTWTLTYRITTKQVVDNRTLDLGPFRKRNGRLHPDEIPLGNLSQEEKYFVLVGWCKKEKENRFFPGDFYLTWSLPLRRCLSRYGRGLM